MSRVGARRARTAVFAVFAVPCLALGQFECPAPSFLERGPLGTGLSPFGVVVEDLNGDRKLDLITANYLAGTVSVLLGNGNGTFQSKVDSPTGAGPLSVAVRDVNGDGKPDLVSANSVANTVSVLLGNGNGTFQTKVDFPTGGSSRSVAVGDLNGDGRSDLVAANFDADSVSVLLGNGNGTFQSKVDSPTGAGPLSLAVRDVNGDGKPDVITANADASSVSVLLGNGNGTFQARSDYSTGARPFSVAVGDLNGDGSPDLVAANEGDATVSVLLGTGSGTFQPKADLPAGATPLSVALGDVNGDGKLDLVVGGTFARAVLVRLGNGNGTFQGEVGHRTNADTVSIAVGDVNGDGKLDIVATTEADALSVQVNVSEPGQVRITRDPLQRTVNAGSTARFTVVVSSPVTVSYQWRRGGVNLVAGPSGNGAGYSGVNAATLTVDSATPADNGAMFDCVVSTPCERRVSLPAILAVVRDCSPPAAGRILRFVDGIVRTGQRVRPGRQLLLRATTTGQGLRYQWYRDGVPLVNGRGVFGARSRALRIENVVPSDAGRYTVVIRNACGPVTVGPANVAVW